jgi:hypothetical protein
VRSTHLFIIRAEPIPALGRALRWRFVTRHPRVLAFPPHTLPLLFPFQLEGNSTTSTDPTRGTTTTPHLYRLGQTSMPQNQLVPQLPLAGSLLPPAFTTE